MHNEVWVCAEILPFLVIMDKLPECILTVNHFTIFWGRGCKLGFGKKTG